MQDIDQSFLSEQKDFLPKWVLGQYNPINHRDVFDEISKEYTVYAERGSQYLLAPALRAFIKMSNDAKAENISIKILSSVRNFDYQKYLWEKKYTHLNQQFDGDSLKILNQILKYLAMPGTSRHHWGTDVDISSVEPEYFDVEPGKTQYEWLCANAKNYGFYQPYNSKKIRELGYNEEKWHWSYMPISKLLLDFYRQNVSYNDIVGFSGDEKAQEMAVIQNYVCSISRECLEFQENLI